MKLPLFYGRFPHFPHYFPHFPYIIGYARLAKLLYETNETLIAFYYGEEYVPDSDVHKTLMKLKDL